MPVSAVKHAVAHLRPGGSIVLSSGNRTRSFSLLGFAAAAFTALALAGCGGGGGNAGASTPQPKTSTGHAATVDVASTGLGNVLIDSHGRTLYLFAKDQGTTSSCSGAKYALEAGDLAIRLTLNGDESQASSTSRLVFDVPSLIGTISEFTSLLPGDVILTGTPGGVRYRREPQLFLQDGDVVAVEVDGVGAIENRALAG